MTLREARSATTFAAHANPSVSDDLTQEARVALASLERGGRLSPEDVLRSAASTNSPLHDYFEWDDSAAAQKHRLEQARQLIRSVRVVVEVVDRGTSKKVVVMCPTYVRDPQRAPNECGYVAVRQLKNESDNARKLLHYEFSRVESILHRSITIAEGLGLSREVKKVAAGISKLIEKVK